MHKGADGGLLQGLPLVALTVRSRIRELVLLRGMLLPVRFLMNPSPQAYEREGRWNNHAVFIQFQLTDTSRASRQK